MLVRGLESRLYTVPARLGTCQVDELAQGGDQHYTLETVPGSHGGSDIANSLDLSGVSSLKVVLNHWQHIFEHVDNGWHTRRCPGSHCPDRETSFLELSMS
jgi:hypothetical protein